MMKSETARRYVLTACAFLFVTCLLGGWLQANVQEWAKSSGQDQYLVKYAGPTMARLADLTQDPVFLAVAWSVIGGSFILWIEYALRRRTRMMGLTVLIIGLAVAGLGGWIYFHPADKKLAESDQKAPIPTDQKLSSSPSAYMFDLGDNSKAKIKSNKIEGDFKILKSGGAVEATIEGNSFTKVPEKFPSAPTELASLSKQALRAEASDMATKLRDWAKSGTKPDIAIDPVLLASAILQKTGRGELELPAPPPPPPKTNSMDAIEKFHIEDSRARHIRWGSMFIHGDINASAAPHVAEFLDFIAGRLGP